MSMFPAVSFLLTVTTIGQAGPGTGGEAELVAAWLKVCTAHARDYRIHPADKPQQKLTLLPKPVFRHHQPVRGTDIGALYVWVGSDGRPVVLGNIFAYSLSSRRDGSRDSIHEMHSLADVPLTVGWRERGSRLKAVYPWTPIPDAAEPAVSAAGRLRQMRLLSRRFRGHSIDRRGGRWELRLIPRPLFQYQAEDSQAVLAGALFAFCQGTDVEIVLTIEARRADDRYRWHYGCADFSDYRLFMRLDDARVWSSPGTADQQLKWSPHIHRVKLPQEDSPEKADGKPWPEP